MNQPLVEDDPQRLGPYDIVGRLGEGGQGVVYLGRAASGEQVAVKLLHHGLLTDPGARNRFLREVEIAQRVARFSTAPVLHADLAGQRPYIVSEYVPGPSLRDLVTVEGPRRGAALDRLAISTATALAAIHRAGILHRDFKPANILMGPEGPVVIDFGIARALDAPGTASTGPLMGTPSYFAPEQFGGAAATEAADIFAWGVTMVFAASGRPAFGADSTPAVINRILNQEPVISGLDGTLLELVTAGLSKDPAKRPSADDLVARLTSLPARPPAGGRRRTMILTIAGCAAAALLVTGGVLINTDGHPVGSPVGRVSTSQSPTRSTTALASGSASTSASDSGTALATAPSQTRKAARRTSPPVPRQTPRLRASAPTAKPTRTKNSTNTPTGNESGKRSRPDPSPGTVPEPAAETTAAPPPAQFPSPPENPFTCIPSMC
ncbi:serine/threonine-protein kinase [Streptosporangium sp. CA-135522]|uniref:serine/threonine-protein kinase n=1 Tax=Streptosporangium sp. CA-135522 TaxID=3240072 RepID=UPI003D8A9DB6